MEDDTVDVYGDINDFDLGNEVERLKTENETLREHIRSLEGDIEKLTNTIVNLNDNRDILKKNISTLFLTAKAEIERKDRMISELRTKNDNICFRRFKPDIENKREREDNFSEGSTAKKFKYDDRMVNETKVNEPNEINKLDAVEYGEIKDNVSEDNTPKMSKYEADMLRREQCNDNHREGYKSRRHSEEREDIENITLNKFQYDNHREGYKSRRHSEEREDIENITLNKFQYDNHREGYKSRRHSEEREDIENITLNNFQYDKRRREEFDDRYHDKYRSNSRPGNRYNNGHRSRSRSRDRNEYYAENRASRYNNFFCKGGRGRKFGDRENWNDNRDTRRRPDNRDFSSRDFRSEYNKTFNRSDNINRETPPNYQKDRKRNENYEKTKRNNKQEKTSKAESDLKVSKHKTSSESISENENSTRIKSGKKRLKMLDKIEEQVRKLRATPIKRDSSPAERTLSNSHIKDVPRNITQEFDEECGKNNFKKCTSELLGKEDSRKIKRSKIIIPDSKIENNDKLLFENQDLIIIDESSNLVAEENVKRDGKETIKSFSEEEGVTIATIQDIKLTIKCHTEGVEPFQLSKDLLESAKQDVKLTAENQVNKERNISTCLEQQNKTMEVANAVNTVDMEESAKEETTYINQDVNTNMDAGNSATNENKEIKDKDWCSSSNDLSSALSQKQRLTIQDYKNRKDVQSKQYICKIEPSSNMDSATENVVHDRKIVNSPSNANEEWKKVEFNKEQNINMNSDSSKTEGENVENISKKDKNEGKKKINILSNIDVTPPIKKNAKVVREERKKEEIDLGNEPKVQNVDVTEKSTIASFDAGDRGDYRKKVLKTKNENSSDTGNDAKRTLKKDTVEIDSSKNHKNNDEKYSKATVDIGSSAKNERTKTKRQHKSLLKEYITNHEKQQNKKLAMENQIEEAKNIKQDLSSVEMSLNMNSDTIDKKRISEKKVKSSPKEDLTIVQVSITVENEEKKIQFEKRINVIEKKEAKKVKTPSSNIIEEEKTVANSKQRESIEKCLDVNMDAQNDAENKKKITKEFRKKDDKDKIETLNVDSGIENPIEDEKKENNKDVKNLSPEDLTDGTEQDANLVVEETTMEEMKNVDQSTKHDKKRSKSLPKQDLPSTAQPAKENYTKKETETVKHFKRRNRALSVDVNLAKDKKNEVKKNSMSKEDLFETSKQGKKEEKIKNKTTDVNQFKEQKIHSFDLSLDPNLYVGNSAKDEKNTKSSTKEDLTNATKQHVMEENKKDRQKNENQDIDVVDKSITNLIVDSSSSYEKAKEKKKRPKECLSDVECNIKEERKNIKENKKQTVNTTQESSSVRSVAATDGKKNSSKRAERLSKENVSGGTDKVSDSTIDHKNVERPKKHKIEDSLSANLDHEKDSKRRTKSPSKDLAKGKQDLGEKERSKVQDVNRKSSSVNLDVESTSKNGKKKRRSSTKETTSSQSEGTEDAIKGVKKKNIKEHSKENSQIVMEVEDKIRTSRNSSMKEVMKKCVDTPSTSKRNEEHDKEEKKKCNVTDAENVSKVSKRRKSELQNTEREDEPSSQVVAKENDSQIVPNRAENVKKNKEEDSKESTDSGSSGETISSKVMKFSDMQKILRGSIEGSTTHGISAEINTKKTKATKKESQNLVHDNKCSTKESKNNVLEEKSRKVSESNDVRKSKECILDSSKSPDTIHNEQINHAKSFEEKFEALFGSYSNSSSDVSGSKENAKNNSMDRENLNNEENVEKITENKICDINAEQKMETGNCDKNKNKEVKSIFDPPRYDVQDISTNNFKNNQVSVNQNIQNATSDKPQTRRRITPTPVKTDKPICTFENILGKTNQIAYLEASPLHLTHEGEIPVLHLEENHISNLPTEANINDKNLMNLLDTMNISNMDCDIPKITCDTAPNSEANSGDSHLNVSPIKGGNSLTFENVISKATSTPVCKNKCQSEKSDITNSDCGGNFIGGLTSITSTGVTSVVENVSVSLTFDNTVKTGVQNTAIIRRRRRRCRMVIID